MGSGENNLSTEEKMAVIDEEIRTLHHFFLSKSFSPLEIEKGAQPFLQAVQSHKRKEKLIKLAEVVMAVVLLVILVKYDPIYNLLITYARLASVNLLLPIWDWRSADHVCFISNPYYTKKELTSEDCEVCETIDYIPRLANLTPDDVMDDYILREAPFIVTDAIQSWPAYKKFDVKFLAQLYTEHETMRDYLGCHFFSNIRKTNHKLLIKLGSTGDVQKYYAYWENCLTPAAKVLRTFYSRPYFLPGGVELQNTNWLFVAQDYKAKSFKPLPIEAPLVWFAQLRGTSRIRVQPRSECVDKCKEMEVTLKSGEMFVGTDQVWMFDYSPGEQHNSVAIGQGGNFD